MHIVYRRALSFLTMGVQKRVGCSSTPLSLRSNTPNTVIMSSQNLSTCQTPHRKHLLQAIQREWFYDMHESPAGPQCNAQTLKSLKYPCCSSTGLSPVLARSVLLALEASVYVDVCITQPTYLNPQRIATVVENMLGMNGGSLRDRHKCISARPHC